MLRSGLRLAGLIVAGMMLSAGAAHAQISIVSTTRDYTATWSDSTFSNANAVYAGSYAYAASAFTGDNFSLSLYSNATNLAYNSAGAVTISPTTAPSPPYTSPETILVSSDGTATGNWGWSYDTAAGAGLPLSYGALGGLATLSFDVGGFDDQSQTIGYYVFVYVPGDWTTEGTSTGDYILNGVAAGFSTPTFTYDAGANTTTVETFDASFPGDGTGPNLSFTLVGSTVVPEPSTWAMMLVGFAGLGIAAARSAKRKAVAA
jgi:hypothetical protein